jgi:hypothetical protein
LNNPPDNLNDDKRELLITIDDISEDFKSARKNLENDLGILLAFSLLSRQLKVNKSKTRNFLKKSNFFSAINDVIQENLDNIEKFKKDGEQNCFEKISVNPIDMTGFFVRNNYVHSQYTFEIKEMGLEYNFSFCSKKKYYSKLFGLVSLGISILNIFYLTFLYFEIKFIFRNTSNCYWCWFRCTSWCFVASFSAFGCRYFADWRNSSCDGYNSNICFNIWGCF